MISKGLTAAGGVLGKHGKLGSWGRVPSEGHVTTWKNSDNEGPARAIIISWQALDAVGSYFYCIMSYITSNQSRDNQALVNPGDIF